MEVTKLAPKDLDELTLLKLSREIAKDIQPIETILERFGITPELWSEITTLPHFTSLVQSEKEAWDAAANTAERVKMKSLSVWEEALPEFFERMHDPREPLIAKAKVLEVIGKAGGVFAADRDGAGPSDGVKITINLGGDSKLTFEKEPRVIEGEIND